jgi:hypothetical protein
MKKQLLPGIALSIFLSLNVAVCANSVRDTSDAAAIQKAEQSGSSLTLEKSEPAQPAGPYQDRLASDSSHDMGARWSWVDRNGNTELMAFTSTAAANNAATLMNNNGGSLSFASFGRVPFLTLTNQVTTNSLTQSTSNPTASLPEPATLTLLGAGLAALAAGLRKKNKNHNK